MSRFKSTPSHKQYFFKAMQTSFPFTDFQTTCTKKELIYNPADNRTRIRTKTDDNNNNCSNSTYSRINRRPIRNTDWSYDGEHGPENWHLHYPVAACDYQSPINIEKRNLVFDESLKKILYSGYDEIQKNLKIFNDGTTVKIRLAEKATVQIKDSLNIYEAFEIRFHWGNANDKGSEHLINGESYPMEVQIYHRNTKYTVDDMYDKQDGLLILAFWVEVTSTTDENSNYNDVIASLSKINLKNEEATLPTLSLESLLPEKKVFYYHYVGSLTTPPCNECVSWIILSETISLSQQQLNKFRDLSSSTKDRQQKLVNNFRPTQKICRRVVKACVEMQTSADN